MISDSQICIAQCNVIVGDIDGNISIIKRHYDDAITQGAELVIFPECCVIGYSAEDLVLFPHFQQRAMQATQELADYTRNKPAAMIIGNIVLSNSRLYNAAHLIDNGEITTTRKAALPNYGVFDEQRVFTAGALPDVITWREQKLGIMICEDMWDDRIAEHLATQNPDIFIVINASPFERNKELTRKALAQSIATKHNTEVIYVNLVGGQDELVFDGGSFAMNPQGNISWHAPYFQSGNYLLSTEMQTPPLTWQEALYQAMITGLRDYVNKNGFESVLIGLSGGIDSALTALIGVDALGADRVHCVMMPSPYTAQISLDDAAELANNLGVRYDILPIQDGMDAIDTMLTPLPDAPSPLALENIQSRLRGLTLMAISNSTNALLITTGNKSEMAVGYATLYGDMCGAYSVLKDVYKTDVFDLSWWRNENLSHDVQGAKGAIMPERIITRPPSAELRDDQKDEDSLPPYEILDAILKSLIEERESVDDIIAEGYDAATVHKVATLLKRAEYKRRQAPPGVKLTPTGFGRDWRLPLTNKAAS